MSMTPLERVVAKIAFPDTDDGCWLWTGARDSKGYAHFGLGGRGGKTLRVHRWLYEVTTKAIPAGLEPDHLCRVRHCVRPDHLEPVTRSVNVTRGKHAIPNTTGDWWRALWSS